MSADEKCQEAAFKMRLNRAGGETLRRFEVEEDTMGRQSAQKRAGRAGATCTRQYA